MPNPIQDDIREEEKRTVLPSTLGKEVSDTTDELLVKPFTEFKQAWQKARSLNDYTTDYTKRLIDVNNSFVSLDKTTGEMFHEKIHNRAKELFENVETEDDFVGLMRLYPEKAEKLFDAFNERYDMVFNDEVLTKESFKKKLFDSIEEKYTTKNEELTALKAPFFDEEHKEVRIGGILGVVKSIEETKGTPLELEAAVEKQRDSMLFGLGKDLPLMLRSAIGSNMTGTFFSQPLESGQFRGYNFGEAKKGLIPFVSLDEYEKLQEYGIAEQIGSGVIGIVTDPMFFASMAVGMGEFNALAKATSIGAKLYTGLGKLGLGLKASERIVGTTLSAGRMAAGFGTARGIQATQTNPDELLSEIAYGCAEGAAISLGGVPAEFMKKSGLLKAAASIAGQSTGLVVVGEVKNSDLPPEQRPSIIEEYAVAFATLSILHGIHSGSKRAKMMYAKHKENVLKRVSAETAAKLEEDLATIEQPSKEGAETPPPSTQEQMNTNFVTAQDKIRQKQAEIEKFESDMNAMEFKEITPEELERNVEVTNATRKMVEEVQQRTLSSSEIIQTAMFENWYKDIAEQTKDIKLDEGTKKAYAASLFGYNFETAMSLIENRPLYEILDFVDLTQRVEKSFNADYNGQFKAYSEFLYNRISVEREGFYPTKGDFEGERETNLYSTLIPFDPKVLEDIKTALKESSLVKGFKLTKFYKEARKDVDKGYIKEAPLITDVVKKTMEGFEKSAYGALLNNPEIAKRLEGTIVTKEVKPGVVVPELLFHGSYRAEKIELNIEGIHVGTKEAALDRLMMTEIMKSGAKTEKGLPIRASKAKFHPVFVNAKNLLETSDLGGWWGANFIHYFKENSPELLEKYNAFVAERVKEQLKTSTIQNESVRSLQASVLKNDIERAAIIDFLKQEGFDGVKYRNESEDVGSTSYWIFDTKNVIPLETDFTGRTYFSEPEKLSTVLYSSLGPISPETIPFLKTVLKDMTIESLGSLGLLRERLAQMRDPESRGFLKEVVAKERELLNAELTLLQQQQKDFKKKSLRNLGKRYKTAGLDNITRQKAFNQQIVGKSLLKDMTIEEIGMLDEVLTERNKLIHNIKKDIGTPDFQDLSRPSMSRAKSLFELGLKTAEEVKEDLKELGGETLEDLTLANLKSYEQHIASLYKTSQDAYQVILKDLKDVSLGKEKRGIEETDDVGKSFVSVLSTDQASLMSQLHYIAGETGEIVRRFYKPMLEGRDKAERFKLNVSDWIKEDFKKRTGMKLTEELIKKAKLDSDEQITIDVKGLATLDRFGNSIPLEGTISMSMQELLGLYATTRDAANLSKILGESKRTNINKLVKIERVIQRLTAKPIPTDAKKREKLKVALTKAMKLHESLVEERNQVRKVREGGITLTSKKGVKNTILFDPANGEAQLEQIFQNIPEIGKRVIDSHVAVINEGMRGEIVNTLKTLRQPWTVKPLTEIGVKISLGEVYVPRASDRTNLYFGDAKKAQINTILESFVHERSAEGGALMIEPFFKSFDSYVNSVGNFVGKHKPALDFYYLLANRDFKNLIIASKGKRFLKNMEEAVKDYRGFVHKDSGAFEKAMQGLMNRAFIPILFKPHIWLMQYTAYLLAGTEIPTKYLAMHTPKGAYNETVLKEMRSYAPFLYSRATQSGKMRFDASRTSSNYMDLMFANERKIGQQILNDPLSPIKIGDQAVIANMWEACKEWGKGEGLSGEALMKFTAEKAQKAVDWTQSTWDPLTRSTLAREAGGSFATRAMVLFTSQTNKIAQLLVKNYVDFEKSAKTFQDYKKLAKVGMLVALSQASVYGIRYYAQKLYRGWEDEATEKGLFEHTIGMALMCSDVWLGGGQVIRSAVERMISDKTYTPDPQQNPVDATMNALMQLSQQVMRMPFEEGEVQSGKYRGVEKWKMLAERSVLQAIDIGSKIAPESWGYAKVPGALLSVGRSFFRAYDRPISYYYEMYEDAHEKRDTERKKYAVLKIREITNEVNERIGERKLSAFEIKIKADKNLKAKQKRKKEQER